MSKKKTPWFGSSQKPARLGVYEIKHPKSGKGFAVFGLDNGRRGWGNTATTVAAAKQQWEWHGKRGAFQDKNWRGFTEPQE